MGNEVKCRFTWGKRSGTGKALLETDEVLFRGEGELPVVIPFKAITNVAAEGAALVIAWSDGNGAPARFELGAAHAARWAEKIANPKARIDKLGIKPGQRVAVVGDVPDDGFLGELKAKGAEVVVGKVPTGAGALDAIFLGVSSKGDLAKIGSLRKSLAPDGALWLVRPKGSAAISEADGRAAFREAGLIDVKVVKFSESHTAEKYVIPVAKR